MKSRGKPPSGRRGVRPASPGLGRPVNVSAALMANAGVARPVAPDFTTLKARLDDGGAGPGALRRAMELAAVHERLDKTIQDARRRVAAEPRSAAAHFALAHALRLRGDHAAAILSYRACLDLDPDSEGARHYLSALGAAAVPAQAPQNLVVELFDRYAEKFDAELVESLKYGGPGHLRDAVERVLGPRAGALDILDAGCGTGLCGAAFKPFARRIDGIDLSPGMIAKAREKAIYAELTVGEVTETLSRMRARYDLVIAGDVLMYIGDIAPLLTAVRGVLRSTGHFAFTIERGPGPAYDLASSGHYRHAAPYVAAEASRAGFALRAQQECVLRFQQGEPVDAAIYVLGAR